MRPVTVSLGDRSYPVFVGTDILKEAGTLVKRRVLSRNAIIVSQKAVASRHGAALTAALSRAGFTHDFFLTPESKSSEAAKSQAVYSKLIKHIAKRDGKNRSVVLIALGGGVIGDLTGFAASVYRRGVPYVQIPTTVTAQVDSSIGGKTGIDLPEGKNLLGTIYQPALVLTDIAVLESLPDRRWSDGFAEVIKYGVIRDPRLFAQLEKAGLQGLRRSKNLEGVIRRCVEIKAETVARDEFDKKGVRITLNFGHTIGHAIEAASRFSHAYTHGEAVAIGMLAACDIASALGVLKDKALPERLGTTLIKFGLPLTYKGLAQDALLKAVGYDKKAEHGKNRFVLPVALGRTIIVRDIPVPMIVEALEKRKG